MTLAKCAAALLVGGALGFFGPAAWRAVSSRLRRARQERALREMLDIPVDEEVQPFTKGYRRPAPNDTDAPRLRSAVIKPTAHDRTRVNLEE